MSAPTKTSAILIHDLSFGYPDCPVLTHLSLSVEQGEFIGIIGPNGGGKTTLLHLLMGFLRPELGSILLDGLPPKRRREEIGFVPQHFQYDRQFPITVLEVVLMGRLSAAPRFGGYSKEDRAVAYEALERVTMRPAASSLFAELSAGQSQRVLLARALASKPRYLFLDEATANVDPATQENLYRLLRELKEQMTILLVTHDLKTALSSVDRMLLVQGDATLLSKEQVCEHFALGLYHPPIHLKPAVNR